MKHPRYCINLATNVLAERSKQEVFELGATRHFLLTPNAYTSVQALAKPTPVKTPNGGIIYATHSCEVDCLQLPPAARQGLIVPEIQHHLLISIRQLCESGCQVLFIEKVCHVYYKGRLVTEGAEHPQTNLWMLPLSTNNNEIYITE